MPGLYLSGPLRLHPVYHTPVVHTRRVYDFAQWGLITLRIFAMIEMRGQHNTSVSLGPRGLCTYYSYRISSLHVVLARPQGAFSMPRATDPGRISERGGAYAPVRHSIPHPSGKSGPAAAESGPGKHYMPGTAWHDAVDSGQRLARAALSRGYRDYYNSQSGGGRKRKPGGIPAAYWPGGHRAKLPRMV